VTEVTPFLFVLFLFLFVLEFELLALARQELNHLSYTPGPFNFSCFSAFLFFNFLLSLSLLHSWDYRYKPPCLSYLLREDLANFLPRLTSNHDHLT
jgi:hypothetical protein